MFKRSMFVIFGVALFYPSSYDKVQWSQKTMVPPVEDRWGIFGAIKPTCMLYLR